MALVHVVPVLGIDDLDGAVDFYVGVLGFRETFRWGDPPFYAGLGLAETGDDSDVHLNQKTQPTGGGEIYLTVDDVEAVHARAVAAGVTVEIGLQDQEYGMRDFSVRDPAGNFVTVGQIIAT